MGPEHGLTPPGSPQRCSPFPRRPGTSSSPPGAGSNLLPFLAFDGGNAATGLPDTRDHEDPAAIPSSREPLAGRSWLERRAYGCFKSISWRKRLRPRSREWPCEPCRVPGRRTRRLASPSMCALRRLCLGPRTPFPPVESGLLLGMRGRLLMSNSSRWGSPSSDGLFQPRRAFR